MAQYTEFDIFPMMDLKIRHCGLEKMGVFIYSFPEFSFLTLRDNFITEGEELWHLKYEDSMLLLTAACNILLGFRHTGIS